MTQEVFDYDQGFDSDSLIDFRATLVLQLPAKPKIVDLLENTRVSDPKAQLNDLLNFPNLKLQKIKTNAQQNINNTRKRFHSDYQLEVNRHTNTMRTAKLVWEQEYAKHVNKLYQIYKKHETDTEAHVDKAIQQSE